MKRNFFYLLTALLASLHGGMAQDVKWAMFGLPYGQDEVIAALAGANPRTAVVIISGNAVWLPVLI